MQIKKRSFIIILISLALISGFAIGYFAGVSWALNWGVNTAVGMMEKQGIEIRFNPGMIAAGLLQYRQNIGGCLFTQNASLYNNTGN